MSGKPNTEQIDELRKLSKRMANLKEECDRQRAIAKEASQKIEIMDTEKRSCQVEMVRLMHAMDVHSSGNNGWEQRITWFLSELCKEQT